MSALTRLITVIPNYNSGAVLLETLAALVQSDYPHHATLIVDDASTDGVPATVAARYPDVTLLRNASNQGFAYSANRGIAEAIARGADFVFLLNNDAIVAPDTVRLLVAAITATPAAAAVMPTIYYYDRPDVIQSTGMRLDRNAGLSIHIGEWEPDRGQFAAVADRDALNGCAMLIRRSAWNTVGPFWEQFFAYYEEADWCVRARDRGYRLLHVPQGRVWHHGGASFNHASARFYYLFFRNQLFFIQRNRRDWSWRRDFGLLLRNYVREVGHALKQRRFRNVAAILRAIYHFGQGRTGALA
jgi:GT2 family glycosyltransferase